MLNNKELRRFYMYYAEGKTFKEVAKEERVSDTAIQLSLKKAEKALGFTEEVKREVFKEAISQFLESKGKLLTVQQELSKYRD
ncbi:hypothetical protein DFO73_107111 [Cytobacillus oceanisediminis]|uniref:Sigma-70-like protein n=1 Tax=Cytobacillus oceanisediminis TaxID=665099 RepID=A0A2V3A2N8_9BACI|nr:hypothetical protein [Cytobacillus oceanisediminis]PWW27801.1 hypothetical protein DFO73_107111 [Cytobacillus oceanisediminis]